MRLPRIDKASATSSRELTVTTLPLTNTVSAVGVEPMNSACAMKDPLLSKSKSSYHEIRRVCQGEILIHLRRRTSSVPRQYRRDRVQMLLYTMQLDSQLALNV